MAQVITGGCGLRPGVLCVRAGPGAAVWLWILRVLELGPEEGARGPGSPGTAFSKRCFLSVCWAPGTPWAQQCPDMDAPTLSSRGLCAKGV